MLALLYYLEFSPAFEPPRETGCDRREHQALRRAAAALRAALGLPSDARVPAPVVRCPQAQHSDEYLFGPHAPRRLTTWPLLPPAPPGLAPPHNLPSAGRKLRS